MIGLLLGFIPGRTRRLPRRELEALVDHLRGKVADLEAREATDLQRAMRLVRPYLERAADGFDADADYLRRPDPAWGRPSDKRSTVGPAPRSLRPKDWEERAKVAHMMAVELRAFATAQWPAISRMLHPASPAYRDDAVCGRVDAVVGA